MALTFLTMEAETGNGSAKRDSTFAALPVSVTRYSLREVMEGSQSWFGNSKHISTMPTPESSLKVIQYFFDSRTFLIIRIEKSIRNISLFIDNICSGHRK